MRLGLSAALVAARVQFKPIVDASANRRRVGQWQNVVRVTCLRGVRAKRGERTGTVADLSIDWPSPDRPDCRLP
jgi:hypothetical protein